MAAFTGEDKQLEAVTRWGMNPHARLVGLEQLDRRCSRVRGTANHVLARAGEVAQRWFQGIDLCRATIAARPTKMESSTDSVSVLRKMKRVRDTKTNPPRAEARLATCGDPTRIKTGRVFDATARRGEKEVSGSGLLSSLLSLTLLLYFSAPPKNRGEKI